MKDVKDVTGLKDALTEIEERNNVVCTRFEKADGEGRELSSDERDEVVKMNKEIEQLELRATKYEEGDAMRAAAEKRKEDMKKRARLALPAPGDKDERDPSSRFDEAKKAQSLGRQVLGDTEFRAWQEEYQRRSGGGTSSSTRVETPKVEVKSLITGISDTSAGATVQTDYKPLVNAAPFKPLTIFDLITIGDTNSDLIEYAQITGYTNNADAVPEATDVDDGSGEKPQSDMALAKKTANVITVAHWIAITTRSLADAGQLRTYIDNFLRWGLRDKMEGMMMLGDGTGEEFLGIINTPGILTQAFTTDIITTTRKARTKVKKQGRVNPTAFVMDPEDWETFDLAKDAELRYYWGGPSLLGTPRLWGVPVVENESMGTGRAILADWKYAVLWLRMMAMISASNSHADFFIRNLVALLAEERAAFGVLYTKAFCDIDLTA